MRELAHSINLNNSYKHPRYPKIPFYLFKIMITTMMARLTKCTTMKMELKKQIRSMKIDSSMLKTQGSIRRNQIKLKFRNTQTITKCLNWKEKSKSFSRKFKKSIKWLIRSEMITQALELIKFIEKTRFRRCKSKTSQDIVSSSRIILGVKMQQIGAMMCHLVKLG